MKRILLIACAVIALVPVGLAAAVFFIPGDVYKTQIERAASTALDREVILQGNVSLSLLPRVSASLEGVEIANPEGFSRPNMLTAGELRGVVRLLPLLSGRVEISEFVFADADLALERLETGEVNWSLGGEATGEAPPPEPAPDGDVPAPPTVDTARLTNATVTFSDAMTGASHTVTGLDITATMAALDAPLSVDAQGVYNGDPFSTELSLSTAAGLLEGEATALDIQASIRGADIGFDGEMVMNETTRLAGQFEADIAALPPLLDLAGVDLSEMGLPYDLAPIGAVTASGTLDGPIEGLTISDLSLATRSDGLRTSLTGALNLSGTPSLEASGELTSGDLGALLAAIGVDLPMAPAALDALDLSFDVSGPVDALSLSAVDLNHRGDLLTFGFTGALGLGGPGRIDGQLSAGTDALRALADAFGSPLPEGDTLQAMSLSTALSGSFTTLSADTLDFALDDTSATGSATVDLSGDKPAITATLAIPTLSLDSFLVASDAPSAPQEASDGWSQAAIDLAALDLVDLDLSLTSDALTLGDIAISNADLDTTIENGALTATINQANLFSGAWSGQLRLDGSGPAPTARMALTGNAVSLDTALATLAGLSSVGGLGQVSIDVTTSGETVDAMVRGLTGQLGAALADGQVKGFNAAQLVRSRDNIVEALASGDLALALSPEAETDFTEFDAVLTLDQGIGTLDTLSFVNPLVLFNGGGTIDLGNRTLDLSIQPSIDENAAGTASRTVAVDGIPIPLRLSGSWLSPSISPDTRLLQQQLQATALDEVRSRVSDQLGGDAGAILDGVLGRGSGDGDDAGAGDDAAPAGNDAANADAAAPADPRDAVEDAARDAIQDRLGGLFGRRSDDTTEDEDGNER